MKFVETEEFWKLALTFFDISGRIRSGEPVKIPDTIVSQLKELLPKDFTKYNPYQVYIDGDVHCNIWWEGEELACGDYYSEPEFLF